MRAAAASTADATPEATPERVVRYTYLAHEERWDIDHGMLQLSETEPFARGGMRASFKAHELDDTGARTPSVLKLFHADVTALAGAAPLTDAREYFQEAMCSSVGESYSQEFNRDCARAGGVARGVAVSFVPCSVVELVDRPGRVFATLEPLLEGSFLKLNDNDGHADEDAASSSETAQAFTYYTYVRSNQLLMVCDIQGVGGAFTDPQVHSFDGEGFGAGNNGAEGFNRFLRSFAYNALCEALNLPKPHQESDEEMARRLQEHEVQTAKEDNAWTTHRYQSELQNFMRETVRLS